MTIREALLIIEAAQLRDARLAWQAANYARFAFHQPNDMPDAPEMPRETGRNRQADVVSVKAWMRAMSQKVAHGS